MGLAQVSCGSEPAPSSEGFLGKKRAMFLCILYPLHDCDP